MRIHILNSLAFVCAILADFFTNWEQRLSTCQDCGQSNYYGRQCK